MEVDPEHAEGGMKGMDAGWWRGGEEIGITIKNELFKFDRTPTISTRLWILIYSVLL